MTFCSALFLLLMLVACNPSVSENKTTEEENQADTTRMEVEPALGIEALDFEGKISTDEGQMSIVKIDIYKKGATDIFQSLTDLALPYEADNSFFDNPTFEDLNFDGIPDLRMPESLGNANVYYAYWIYNPATKKFEKNTEMTLSLPTIDADKNEIMSFERGSAASYLETTYAYQDGKFVAIRIENKEYESEKQYQSIVQERQADGTMKEVRNELVEVKD